MGEVSYKGHRYPAEIIAHCVWLYHRLPLSFREVEELMLVRGVIVTYETTTCGHLQRDPLGLPRELDIECGRMQSPWIELRGMSCVHVIKPPDSPRRH